ncbi:N-acetyl-D-Glu racemase DgcA [Aureimonas sp. AU40]|uniref:N-acetyl-D-Glu racemase DgcA n=1 Tax=Aureimonas sp. AU40 TaxID=1637747 RepID=UPI0007837D63|nr:N-acetyl-D-Glu racemase DgcA [Aureimonas sp. AU40]
MTSRLSVTVDAFSLAKQFTIARGAKTEAVVVACTLADGTMTGRGECVPYARYGESVDSVVGAIESVRGAIDAGLDRASLQALLPPGAARNALDCAFWDLEAKRKGARAADLAGIGALQPVETAYTISLGSPEEMAAATRAVAHRAVLKVKVGRGDEDPARMQAVRAAAPQARLIIDANEGWTPNNLKANLLAAAGIGAFVVEQPLPANEDAILAHTPHPVPICADESVHGSADLHELVGRYDYVNLKLDKTGGLTEGLVFLAEARRLGFGVMVGCMVGTSLGMAPALLLAKGAELVDLDGPLLLREDRPNGLRYEGSLVWPPEPALWG